VFFTGSRMGRDTELKMGVQLFSGVGGFLGLELHSTADDFHKRYIPLRIPRVTLCLNREASVEERPFPLC